MTILLTGGTGKTSVRIARFLQDAHTTFLLASRRGEAAAPTGMPAAKFDWLDASTYESPFQHPSGKDVTAVYLVAPEVADPSVSMGAFIDYAISKHGVKRFVLLAGSSAVPGGHHPMGKVWQHLIDAGVEYCVLLPTWFMENFAEPGQGHVFTIKGEGKIYTACGDAKIPFVSANDIAAVAFHALTVEKIQSTDYRVLGPELLTYDQVAAKLSGCLGKKIVHVKLTEEERVQHFVGNHLPEHFARFLTSLELAATGGSEERMNDCVEQVTGRPPQSLDAFAKQHMSVWQ